MKITCTKVLETHWVNCKQVWAPPTPGDPNKVCEVDGVNKPCPVAPKPGFWWTHCDMVKGPGMVDQCTKSGGEEFKWTGCVGSRNPPNHVNDGNYAGAKIPGLLQTTCGSPLLNWTPDLASVRTMINGLTTKGPTYLPAGLIWGWRMLSTQIPFAGRTSTAGKPVKRYMIFVTDGQNTRSASFPKHDWFGVSDANDATGKVCQNMSQDKDTNARLYTIAFEVTDPTVKTLLQKCSSDNGGEFFDAANANQLNSALKNIGGQISQLRLTK